MCRSAHVLPPLAFDAMRDPTGDTTIMTDRLVLRQLCVADVGEMAVVLADPALHQFTGGRPATLEELNERYASWVHGSGSATELWLNWIVRRRNDEVAIGTVQATVVHRDERREAAVAWTIGTPWQRQGYASEATLGLLLWLRNQGIDSVVAHIHPGHAASTAVAMRAGLHATGDVVDGETVWRLEIQPALEGQSV